MMDKRQLSFFGKIKSMIQVVEDGLLVLMVLVMIVFAVAQILLRNFFDSGIIWGDSFVRVLVLWVGLFGAMVATRQKNHIQIDIVSRYVSDAKKRVIALYVDLFSALVSFFISWFGFFFVKDEFSYGELAFAKVPVWFCESLIVFAFAVMGIRFLFSFFVNVKKLKSKIL